MNQYKITFFSLDSNEMQVYITANTKEKALLIFESEYTFLEIKECKLID